MNLFNSQSTIPPSLLATDLDGTLIPLPETPHNTDALAEISRQHESGKFGLIFATGRHFESVLAAISEYNLPTPEWIACDVGTAIYKREGSDFAHYTPYENHLAEKTGAINRTDVETLLNDLEGLELQAPDHQQRFKISYQSSPELLENLIKAITERLTQAQLPYACMGSLDPFLNCGLIDVLPQDASKAYALIWLATHADFTPDQVIYSGDSGNDYAALISGFRAIVVANGSKGLADRVTRALEKRGLSERVYLAKSTATSGVLEGCRHFGLLDG